MKLSNESLKNSAFWEKAGIALPALTARKWSPRQRPRAHARNGAVWATPQ